MSDLLSIGASAVRAYRGALGAIGENVANAETPGYSRRTVVLRQAATPGISPDPIYGDQLLFSGVSIGGVQRAWDSFRASEARFAASAAGAAAAREQWLVSVETAFGSSSATVGASMTVFFNTAASLAANPGELLGRTTMLTSLGDVAGAFRTSAEALGRVSEGIRSAAALDIEAVNDSLTALDDINATIRASKPGGAARAALEDERDRLITEIAGRLDIGVTIAGDGTAALTLGGAASVSLLDGGSPGFIDMVVATDGRISLQLTKDGSTVPLPATSGSLAGLVRVAGTTADRRAALDVLAIDFATAINDWSADGLDLAGNPGGPLLDASGGAVSIDVLVTDPALVAAQSTDGRANGNLLALDALRGPTGPESRWNALVADCAQSLSAARAEASAAASWRDNSFASLDEVTGIDLDREAAELLRFQQAYGAASRIIQVARETFDTLVSAL
ncbi:flagellar hook-associated protein FlgK [Sphingosinicella sp. CPCC 101087]|uniref:flagellar hook-associated protein FlgK n=1 Tax=Sphingosinicella sp. CPCC 101087 TaxID=2497754 RepID=UPI00101D9729|nr:flagellar hook-associated protein FlgK [Sphingosinicella sp. CPCC 101087]